MEEIYKRIDKHVCLLGEEEDYDFSYDYDPSIKKLTVKCNLCGWRIIKRVDFG